MRLKPRLSLSTCDNGVYTLNKIYKCLTMHMFLTFESRCVKINFSVDFSDASPTLYGSTLLDLKIASLV